MINVAEHRMLHDISLERACPKHLSASMIPQLMDSIN
jgi:hypothetical protein